MTGEYDDIINFDRPISKKRKPMTIINRAAQFAPFAALTGYDDAIKETARLTESRIELDVHMKEEINNKLQILVSKIKDEPKINITYFKPDDKKDVGAYVGVFGTIKKVDNYNKTIFINDGKAIPIDEIVRIEGEVFQNLEQDVLAYYACMKQRL